MPLFVDETGIPGSPTIIFLHGVGTSGWMWWNQIAALSDFHCLNVDLPGHGKSHLVPWISFTDTADLIAAIIQSHATGGTAYVVGLSLGAYVVLVLMSRHPNLVRRAVLSGVTTAPMPNRIFLQPQLWLMSTFMTRRWYVSMQAKALGLPPKAQAAFTDNLLRMSMHTYRTIFEEAADFRIPESLHHMDIPTLATAGGKESKIILQAVDEITSFMPVAQGRIAPGLGHGWNVQAPDLFSAMVRAWICDAPLPVGLRARSMGAPTTP